MDPIAQGLPMHPHQIEVQEFCCYELIIDARPRREYLLDHIPGAVNLMLQPRGYARTPGSGSDNYDLPPWSTGGECMPFPHWLFVHLGRLEPGDSVLVYSENPADSELWAASLRPYGFVVDILVGGYASYRRWVDAALELLPRALPLRLLSAPAASGLDRLLQLLGAHQRQVVDLTHAGGGQLIPGMVLPGDFPSQAMFESCVVGSLRLCDPSTDVWITVPAPASAVALPPALRERLGRMPTVEVTLPLAERVLAWAGHLEAQRVTVMHVVEALASLPSPPQRDSVLRWQALARESRTFDTFVAVMREFLDPAYSTYTALEGIDGQALYLTSLQPESLDAHLAAELTK